MKIVDYDQADPIGVLNLNLLSLDYALTPERVALIRHLDPRPFPFFGVYAIEGGIVAGQVAVYRLTMISTEGPEDVGGACAVCTHPAFNRQGIAARLFDETHARMRAAGLRFSTLGTTRYRGAYDFYRRQGYEDVLIANSTFARFDAVRKNSTLRVERASKERLPLADAFFPCAAAGRLGFARRTSSFLQMLAVTGDLNAQDVWLIWDQDNLAGYALARVQESILKVDDVLLADRTEAAEVVAAIAHETGAEYLHVRINRPSVAASLMRAGYPHAYPGWSTFMVKPLIPNVTTDDFRRRFGVSTEEFMIAPVDVT